MGQSPDNFADETERNEYFEQLLSGQMPAQPQGRELLQHLANPAVRGPFLETLLRQPLPAIEEFTAEVAAASDDRALLVLTPLLHSIEESVALSTIDALGKVGSPAARPALEERANFDRRMTVRRAAARTLDKLPDDTEPPVGEVQLPLHNAYLTAVDGAGAQMALVARRWSGESTDEIDVASFHVIFDDTEGIQEAFGVPTQPSSEFVDMLDDLEDGGLTPVSVPLPEIRAAVEDAYDRTLENRGRVSVTFAAWRSILCGEDSRQIPPVELPDVSLDEAFGVFTECHHLLDLDEFGTWYFEPHEISGAVDKLHSLQRRRGKPDYEGRLVGLIRQTLDGLFPPHRRQRFQRRLERQAPLLARIHEDPIHARRALAAAAGLAADVQVPVTEHPLLQEMLVRSLEDALGRPLVEEQEEIQ